MTDAATAQVIHPPDRLRTRLGARFAGVDPEAAARAREALQRLSDEFGGWLQDEAAGLAAARDRFLVEAGPDAWGDLHRRAHDLKGLAGTCGFPVVTRICASLCRLLEGAAGSPPDLIDAHLDAVGALLRQDDDGSADAARAICETLEARTAAAAGAGDPRG